MSKEWDGIADAANALAKAQRQLRQSKNPEAVELAQQLDEIKTRAARLTRDLQHQQEQDGPTTPDYGRSRNQTLEPARRVANQVLTEAARPIPTREPGDRGPKAAVPEVESPEAGTRALNRSLTAAEDKHARALEAVRAYALRYPNYGRPVVPGTPAHEIVKAERHALGDVMRLSATLDKQLGRSSPDILKMPGATAADRAGQANRLCAMSGDRWQEFRETSNAEEIQRARAGDGPGGELYQNFREGAASRRHAGKERSFELQKERVHARQQIERDRQLEVEKKPVLAKTIPSGPRLER